MARQHIGHRIFLVTTGERFDGVHHRIDAGGGGHKRWQTQGQGCIEDGQVRVQLRRDHAHLGRFACRYDGNVGDLRTRTGRRRNLHQRQTATFDVADTVNVSDLLLARCQHGDELGDVHRTAAAQPDHNVNALLACKFNCFQDDGFRRIGNDISVDMRYQSRFSHTLGGRLDQSGTQKPRVGHDQCMTCLREVLRHMVAELCGRAGF